MLNVQHTNMTATITLWATLFFAGVTSVEAQSTAAAKHYEQGVRENRQGLLVAATVSLTEAISQHPNYADAYLQRGLSFEGLGKVDAAIRDYSAAIEHGGDSLLPYQKLFAWCRNERQYERGIELAKKLVEHAPSNAAAGFWEMGRFHDLQKDRVGALNAYRQALEHLPAATGETAEDQDFRRALERKIEQLDAGDHSGSFGLLRTDVTLKKAEQTQEPKTPVPH